MSTERDVISAFRRTALRYPDNAAIVTDGRTDVTYAELDAAVMRIAAVLRAKGIGHGKIVAISIEKSWEYVAAVLGTWAAGGAFMPLPPNLPAERRNFQLTDAEPSLVITEIDSLMSVGASAENLPVAPRAEDLAYIIYTSGSSGRPKGVMVPHAGLLGVLEDQIKLFKFGPDSRSLFLLSMGFDASISDIGTTLLSGAALYIETGERIETVAHLNEIMTKRGITHVDLPPSLLGFLDPDQPPPSLRTMVIGGESASDDLVRTWASRVRLVNVYGPTEATICTSAVVCDRAWDGPNIGKPIAGMRYVIVDGELWITGPGLAIGYLHNDALNRERFVFHGGKRYYRTGDNVRQKGRKIYFVGRRDRQVKVSGQLVAPEEIEAQLLSHDAVTDAVVIAVSIDGTMDTSGSRTRLTAFIETAESLTDNDLGSHLKKRLPDWMTPHRFVFLKALPRNTSGKKDLAKLRAMAAASESAPATAEAADELERRILEIWQGVLGRQIGLDDDFFAFGGDSLAVLQAVTAAEKRGLAVPIGLMIANPTVRALASRLHAHSEDTKSDGRSAEGFAADFELTPEWRKKVSVAALLPPSADGRIFITGATGFLGSHLLAQLLLLTDRSITVLVRAASADAGLARVMRACQKYGVMVRDEDKPRIEVLLGDILAPSFGLAPVVWKKLATDVSEIYHCAAIVNMVLRYEDLRAANVDGVKEIARLAMTGARKKLNYASTLSVFVATDRNTGTALERDDLSATRKIYGGYAQSKWAAERFLREIPEEALSANIFRFGLITGDSVTGASSSHDFLLMFVRGLIALGSAPDGDHESLRLDVTPIDFAAKAMAIIGQGSPRGYYHVANRGGFSLKMILDALQARGVDIKIMEAKQWRDEIVRRSLDADASAAFAALCRLSPDRASFERLRGMDLFQATDMVFDTKNTDAALRGSGVVIPAPDRALLDRYLATAITSPS